MSNNSMAPPRIIDLTDSEGPSGLGAGRSALQVVSNKPIAKRAPAAKKKAAPVKNKAHVLIWIPHNGTKSKTWSKLKVMGVYSSKEKAMAERELVISRYSQCGYGGILVGPTWDDEIDLIVKPADCFFDAA